MPANLTPDYHRAETRFRDAKSPEERLAALEEMLRVIPKHKGTDHMQADLKRRIAQVRRDAVKQGGRGGFSHVVPREGAGQVTLVGLPNSGKSSLVRALTHATPAVADYPFTTREPVPGMMRFEDIGFQLVDLPPVSPEHVEPWIFDLVRHADLVWLVVDGRTALEDIEAVQQLLGGRHLRLFPAGTPGPRPVLGDPATVHPALLVVTGLDRPGVGASVGTLDELLDRRWPLVAVSTTTGEGIDALPARTFATSGLIRVYTKQPGKPADRSAPFTLPAGATVGDLAERIHKDLMRGMAFARVWGPSAFDGQAVQKDHVLAEGDVVEVHG
jgi:hypothetical protein